MPSGKKRPDPWNGHREELVTLYGRMRATFPKRSHAKAEFLKAARLIRGVRREGETVQDLETRFEHLFENLERRPPAEAVTADYGAVPGEVIIQEIIQPRLVRGARGLQMSSFPASGWVGVKVFSRARYKGCTGVVKTDSGEFPLFDWEEYMRNIGQETRYGADPYKSFTLDANEIKRLYTEITTNSDRVTVFLDMGNLIAKDLPLPEWCYSNKDGLARGNGTGAADEGLETEKA